MHLDEWLSQNFSSSRIGSTSPVVLEANSWKEIRLFLSSTFIDTHAERDALIKRVIPKINRKLASRSIRIVPVDLRWGLLSEESKDCEAIQKTCLNQLDKCRQKMGESAWFLGILTERYGWIQDKLMASEGFENPRSHGWLDKFRKYGKEVSITSLECICASMPPTRKQKSPTVFYYKRQITNLDDIERNMCWVFDFEYVTPDTKLQPDSQYQYTKTSKANAYMDDKGRLDKYLKGLDHTRYSTYQCHYEKGGARFTDQNEGIKRFGVGYVNGLSEFEERVEKDLLEAIDANFQEMDTPDVPEFVFIAIQHENAVRLKASTFVGRTDLHVNVFQHCTSKEVENNVMLIHGEPGCGKSGLLSAVARQCLDELRAKGDFVFVHAVDSCPGSDILELMLRRLQLCLRKYRRDLGETDLTQECPSSTADLKVEHVTFLEESTAKYPAKMFIILVDAVNQFHASLRAWKMWWLPSENISKNLRFIITTLNEENGTFKNACIVCPNAVKVPVGDMSYEDRKNMVSATLARFNKKLATVNDPFLGNQMDVLLSKSESPLYLIAATEALRRFGIFEKVSVYLDDLPDNISELFSFLLDEWAGEHGVRFIQDVTCLLCLSKDGLLENEINDILSYKETEEGFLYESSFCRLYDSLSSFLAAGGGGYLRFFHDQLAYEVRRKFLTPKVERLLHKWLADFFLKCIRPQLCQEPTEEPLAYYKHCLQQVVYHQIESCGENKELADSKASLRNIYFVRERIKNHQQQFLQHEYLHAIKRSIDVTEIKALKQWAKFAQLYRSYIEQFPEWCYNMAANQSPTSYVAMDTSELPLPTVGDGYPLYWTNNPSLEDPVVLKYTSTTSFSCTSSIPEGNLCCIGGEGKAFLYEQNSGVLIHEIKVEGKVTSVYISRKCDTFWIGNSKGYVSVWNVDTGSEEWKSKIRIDNEVGWIEQVGGYVACGTCHKDAGVIGMVDEQKRKVVRRWSTESKSYCYCFHSKKKLIFSGHDGLIKGWNTDGRLVKKLPVSDVRIVDINAHPKKNVLVYITIENKSLKYCMKQWNFSTDKNISSTPDTRYPAMYNRAGERILCVGRGPDRKAVMIHSLNGRLLEKLKGHSSDILNMSLVPSSNDLLTAAYDGSLLFTIPTSAERISSQKVPCALISWCEFLPDGETFATLNDFGKLSVWTTSSCELTFSVDIDDGHGGRKAVIHPKANYICVRTKNSLHWQKSSNLVTVNVFPVRAEDEDKYEVDIADVKISPDGERCVVATFFNGAVVLDIRNVNKINKSRAYKIEGRYMHSCDIHSDNVQVVSGGSKVVDIWNIVTGETIHSFREKRSTLVRFVHEPDGVVFTDGNDSIHLMDFNGTNKLTFESKVDHSSPVFTLIRNRTQLMTADARDGSLRIFDLASGKVIYVFTEHRSEGFNCLAVHPSSNMVIAGNKNGMFYVLKNTRESTMQPDATSN